MNAESAPPEITINPETKECGYYWCGDECEYYYLPLPWTINYGCPIQSEMGLHQWNRGSMKAFTNK
jgi:hypothetical protein